MQPYDIEKDSGPCGFAGEEEAGGGEGDLIDDAQVLFLLCVCMYVCVCVSK